MGIIVPKAVIGECFHRLSLFYNTRITRKGTDVNRLGTLYQLSIACYNRCMQHIEYPGYDIHEDGIIIGPRGKALTPFLSPKGYPKVTLYVDGKKVNRFVHRLVAEVYIPQQESKMPLQVNHKDLDKTNYHASNLEWVTCSQNVRHRIGRPY